MPNPRAISVTRDSDVQLAEWPVATASLLQDFQRLEKSHEPDQINQALFFLIKARKAIGDARLYSRYARKLYSDNAALCERLDSIAESLAQDLKRFPLSLLGQSLVKGKS